MFITPYISQSPVDNYGLRPSNLKYSASLAATTDTELTVPGDSNLYKADIVCETDGDVWVAVGATAAVPAGATFATTTSQLVTGCKPLCIEVKAGEVIHFYTATADTAVSVAFYSVYSNN